MIAQQSGVATSPSDLLSALATFAAANGWTVSTVSVGRVFRNTGVVVGVHSDSTNVLMRGAITYNGAANWDAQTGAHSANCVCDVGAGPYTAYDFFVGDEEGVPYLNVAVEITSGIYRHFAIGSLVKQGAYTGGTYVDCVNHSDALVTSSDANSTQHQYICDSGTSVGTAHLYVDYDSKTNNYQVIGNAGDFTTTKCCGTMRQGSVDCMFQNNGVQAWNLRNLMAPLNYYANRASNLRSPMGRISNMRLVSMANLLPREVITVGGADWVVMPCIQRSFVIDNVTPSSANYGYAYKLP
jgi:hypothetical protein